MPEIISQGQPDPIRFHYVPPGYEPLAEILARALDQAAYGKGKDRHAGTGGRPFLDQPIIVGMKMYGEGGGLFQAFKKAEESQRMTVDAAVAELLGGIVYLGAAAIVAELGVKR